MRWLPCVLLLLAAPLPLAAANCPAQPVHHYVLGLSVGAESRSLDVAGDGGAVVVLDASLRDCDADGMPEFDGDYDLGVGGGFFGHGPWAWGGECDYDLHLYGPVVTVNDWIFANVGFMVGENDQDGPLVVRDPFSDEVLACVTDGVIAPDVDPDDCLSPLYLAPGPGWTCGTGGGDGGYWVFVHLVRVHEGDNYVEILGPGLLGTIVADYAGFNPGWQRPTLDLPVRATGMGQTG